MVKKFIPYTVKKFFRDLLGITELHERVDRLYTLLLESKEEVYERSKVRWLQSKPTIDLTWGKKITGDAFVSKVVSYSVFDQNKTILEVGAGYGRLLKSCLKLKVPFKKYIAVDISKRNVDYLRKTFPMENIHILHGNIEELRLPVNVDVILSSLTFKHLFPSFERALCNITKYANPNSTFFFDLIEGESRIFEGDNITYIRSYSRNEILKILGNSNLQLIAFDYVQHTRQYSRLFVVARKPTA